MIMLIASVYGIIGFLNVMILDATDPDQMHMSFGHMLWHDFLMWPLSMWYVLKDIIENWNTPCDSH